MSIINNVHIFKGDITQYPADVIVNAANSSLLGGGGVDGLIHRKGGKEVLEECQKIRNAQGGCKVGKAVITTAGKLPFKAIIHSVGPAWIDGKNQEKELLEECYRSCFQLAKAKNFKTISFPNISTGRYGFPKDLAAEIVFKVLLDETVFFEQINFVCFDIENYFIYLKIFNKGDAQDPPESYCL